MNTIKQTYRVIRDNFRTLIVFEIFYRLLGLAIIFPLADQLLYFSVRLTGNEYVINKNFVDYITSPTTFLTSIVLLLIVGVYIMYEIVALTLLFYSSKHDIKIGIQTLLIGSFRKTISLFKKYHFSLLISSTIFLLLVEGMHIVGIASTFELPALIQDQLYQTVWLVPTFIFVVVILVILFIETIFYEIESIIHPNTIKKSVQSSRKLLIGNRLRILVQFIFINSIINLVIYVIYLFTIGIIGTVLFFFTPGDLVYPYILSLLYSVYIVVGFIATIILLPANFAWIHVLYNQYNPTSNSSILLELNKIRQFKPFKAKIFYRILGVALIILAAISIYSLSAINQNPAHLQLLNNPAVISHRGGGYYGPENTISSIEKGIEYGSDAVEIDVRFTKDGIPILMHDATIDRTTNSTLNAKVSDLPYQETQFWDAGSWFDSAFAEEKIPTLEDALLQIDNRVDTYIEIKAGYNNSAEIIMNIITETNSENTVKILSFDESFLRQCKEINPDIKVVLLISNFIGDVEILIEKDWVDYYGIKYDVARTDKPYIKSLQEAGKGILVWTVNDRESMIEMNNLGVDGIITDYPLITREVIYSDSLKTDYARVLEKLFIQDN